MASLKGRSCLTTITNDKSASVSENGYKWYQAMTNSWRHRSRLPESVW